MLLMELLWPVNIHYYCEHAHNTIEMMQYCFLYQTIWIMIQYNDFQRWKDHSRCGDADIQTILSSYSICHFILKAILIFNTNIFKTFKCGILLSTNSDDTHSRSSCRCGKPQLLEVSGKFVQLPRDTEPRTPTKC